MIFHNESKYDHNLIIKQAAKEFEEKNIEKCKTFSVPVTKEVKRVGIIIT